jgi:hypothetical protein
VHRVRPDFSWIDLPVAENEHAIGLLERLGAARDYVGTGGALRDRSSGRDEAGLTLRELLRAVGAGLLAPARTLLQRQPPGDE